MNLDCIWKDTNGRTIRGKARPIAELEIEFAEGKRSFSNEDRSILGKDEGDNTSWEDLDIEEQQRVLNNYRLKFTKMKLS